MTKSRAKAKKAKAKSARQTHSKRRPVAHKPGAATLDSAGFDTIVREFDGSVENIHYCIDRLQGSLSDVVELNASRDRIRRLLSLAEDGILHDLQRLASALDECHKSGTLPESIKPVGHGARLALDRLCRAFGVVAVCQPGEFVTVLEEEFENFDWSADRTPARTFPILAEVIRSGWKAGESAFVLPKVRTRPPVA